MPLPSPSTATTQAEANKQLVSFLIISSTVSAHTVTHGVLVYNAKADPQSRRVLWGTRKLSSSDFRRVHLVRVRQARHVHQLHVHPARVAKKNEMRVADVDGLHPHRDIS